MKKSPAIMSLALGAALSLAACSKNNTADNPAVAAENGATDISADESNGFDAGTLGNSDDVLTSNTSEIANAQ